MALQLALVREDSSVLSFVPGLLLMGLGVGVMLTSSVNVVQSSFPVSSAAAGSGGDQDGTGQCGAQRRPQGLGAHREVRDPVAEQPQVQQRLLPAPLPRPDVQEEPEQDQRADHDEQPHRKMPPAGITVVSPMVKSVRDRSHP